MHVVADSVICPAEASANIFVELLYEIDALSSTLSLNVIDWVDADVPSKRNLLDVLLANDPIAAIAVVFVPLIVV